MECCKLAEDLFTFTKEIAYIKTVHLKQHVFEGAEVKESTRKLLVASTEHADNVFAVIVSSVFVLYSQAILDEHCLFGYFIILPLFFL